MQTRSPNPNGDGPCYFGKDHPGWWRSCCNHFMCDAHFRRIDLRIPAAVKEQGMIGLAKWALRGGKLK